MAFTQFDSLDLALCPKSGEVPGVQMATQVPRPCCQFPAVGGSHVFGDALVDAESALCL